MDATISIMCYNYGRYLARAIESALNQRGHGLAVEVLVIDDGSTDQTPEVCDRYAPRIRVLRSENQGFTASLTRAIRQARGGYVCLLDADDYFDETKLHHLESFMRAGYDLMVNQAYQIDEERRLLSCAPKGGGSTSTLCINRAKALDLLPAHNEIYFHALKHLGRTAKIERPLTYYRVHGESMVRSREASSWYDELASVTHGLADHLEGLAAAPPSWTDAASLTDASHVFRTTASYDEMEAALLRGRYFRALKKCGTMLRNGIKTPNGIGTWHLKLAARCLQGRPIEATGA